MSFTTLGLRAARLARTSTTTIPRLSTASSSLSVRNNRQYSSPSNPNQFSAPTNPALNTDEAKNRPGYEEYREEVEPKYANVDQSFVFDHPKVRFLDIPLFHPLSYHIRSFPYPYAYHHLYIIIILSPCSLSFLETLSGPLKGLSDVSPDSKAPCPHHPTSP